MRRMIAWTAPALIGALTLLAVSVALASGDDRSPALTPNAAVDTPSAPAGQQSANHGVGSAAMSEQIQDCLDLVRRRGHLVCATSDAIPGFGYLADGENAGFDVDLCRAVAAAALGDPNAVEFRISIPTGLGAAVRSGEIDMVARILTATTTREAEWGNFVHTMYYDGQGFVVRRSLGVATAGELAGASVCVTENTTTELNLADFSRLHRLNLRAVAFAKTSAAVDAYLSVFPDPSGHAVLPDVISEEPLTPLVPHGDDRWYDIVKTVMAILIYAEAYGVTSDSVPAQPTGDARVDRLFGLAGSFGQEDLGLSRTVAQDVIRAVGNYGEIYDRHLAPLGLERRGSRNALWAGAPCSDCPGAVRFTPRRCAGLFGDRQDRRFHATGVDRDHGGAQATHPMPVSEWRRLAMPTGPPRRRGVLQVPPADVAMAYKQWA